MHPGAAKWLDWVRRDRGDEGFSRMDGPSSLRRGLEIKGWRRIPGNPPFVLMYLAGLQVRASGLSDWAAQPDSWPQAPLAPSNNLNRLAAESRRISVTLFRQCCSKVVLTRDS